MKLKFFATFGHATIASLMMDASVGRGFFLIEFLYLRFMIDKIIVNRRYEKY